MAGEASHLPRSTRSHVDAPGVAGWLKGMDMKTYWKSKSTPGVLVCALLLTFTAGSPAGLFGPKGDSAEEKRQNVRKQRDEMLAELYRLKPEMKDRLKQAAGYATFKQTDVNLFLLASGNGYGMLVDNKTGKETVMRVASLGGGVGLGLKDLRVIFVFNDSKVLKQFLDQGWQFGGKADASAKYQDTGVSAEQNVKANVDFKEGTVAGGSSTDMRAGTEQKDTQRGAVSVGGAMEIYQFTESGVSLQATVQGTKYWKDSKLNK
jgi:lipid-binding SYLF domain-containing protein